MQTLATQTELNPADLRMLKFLGSQARPATAKEVGAYLQMGTGAVTALLDRLERRQIIERTRNPEDHRSVLVALGPNGRPVVDGLRRSYESVLRASLGDLDSEALRLFLGRLTQAFASSE
ncbi:MAG: MarR family transcriptional regulator [Curtobacterium sp.]